MPVKNDKIRLASKTNALMNGLKRNQDTKRHSAQETASP